MPWRRARLTSARAVGPPSTTEIVRETSVSAFRCEAGGGEIASAGDTEECLNLATEGNTDARDFRESTRQKRALGVGSEAHAIGDTRRNGDDILARAREFDADQIVRLVDLGPR